MKTARIWITRVIVITLLTAAVIKSPTAFISALLGVILAGYLIYLWLKWKFWRIMSPLGEMGKAISQTTLNLQKSDKPFHNPEQVKADLKTLEQNGFTILGTYSAKQIPLINIVLANNQPEGVHALIMDKEHLGVTTEFCSRYEDDKTFTCSNTRMPGVMPRPDSHPISRLPNCDVQTVLNQFKESRPQSAICKIRDEEIQSQIESLYKELKVHQIETLENTVNREAQLLENFIIHSGWSAIEWHRKQNDIVIIHDKIKDYELIDKYERAVSDEDEHYVKMKGRVESIIKNNTPINAIKILSSEIPTNIRLKKILELTEPMPAHVYLAEKPKG